MWNPNPGIVVGYVFISSLLNSFRLYSYISFVNPACAGLISTSIRVFLHFRTLWTLLSMLVVKLALDSLRRPSYLSGHGPPHCFTPVPSLVRYASFCYLLQTQRRFVTLYFTKSVPPRIDIQHKIAISHLGARTTHPLRIKTKLVRRTKIKRQMLNGKQVCKEKCSNTCLSHLCIGYPAALHMCAIKSHNNTKETCTM